MVGTLWRSASVASSSLRLFKNRSEEITSAPARSFAKVAKNRIEITLGAGLKDMKLQFTFFRCQFQLPHERLCKGGDSLD